MDTLLLILNFFVFVLLNFVLARITVIGPDQPVIAAVGENAILPCHFSYPEKLTEVRYFRFKDGRRPLINHFQDGKDQQKCELQEYIGRTELMNKNIAHGRTALKLLNVSVSDEGTYRCFLQTRTNFDAAIFELRVTALGSNPRIEIENFQDDRILAVCRSNGWYPKPTVLDRDDDGKAVALNGSEIILRQQDNLFSVVYHRVITETSNRTFSCLLRTPYHPDMISSLYVADRVFRKVPSPGSYLQWIWPVCFALLILVVVGGAFFYLKRPRKKTEDLRSNFNKLPSEEETAETGSSGAPEREPLKNKELKMKSSLKRLSWCLESKITDSDAVPEGAPEREPLKNEELKTKRSLKRLSWCLESKITDSDAAPEGDLERELLKNEEAQREKLTLEKHKEPIKETTDPNETIIQLRNEMKTNADLVFKWQKELKEKDKELQEKNKELKEKDKAIEALKKELELLKMESRSGQVLTLQSFPSNCGQTTSGETRVDVPLPSSDGPSGSAAFV